MRGVLASLVLVLTAAATPADDKPAARYGIAPDPKTYPQATAKEALASVLKAIDAKRFEYLVAQLADPAFVDDRVKRLYGGRFEQQVEDTRTRLDPFAVKQLRRFLKDGTWEDGKDEASVRLKDVPERRVYLRRAGGRWYLEHRSAAKAKS
jgi:hypothetical protein